MEHLVEILRPLGGVGAGILLTIFMLKILLPFLRRNGNGSGARALSAGELPPSHWEKRFEDLAEGLRELALVGKQQTAILERQTAILEKVQTNTAVLLDRGQRPRL